MHVNSPLVQEVASSGTCASRGSFEEHGLAQLQAWVGECLGRMGADLRQDLINYIMQIGVASLMCSGTDSPALVFVVVLPVVYVAIDIASPTSQVSQLLGSVVFGTSNLARMVRRSCCL